MRACTRHGVHCLGCILWEFNFFQAETDTATGAGSSLVEFTYFAYCVCVVLVHLFCSTSIMTIQRVNIQCAGALLQLRFIEWPLDIYTELQPWP